MTENDDWGAALDEPLPGVFRQTAEGQLNFAKELLEASERDLRLLLDGKARTTFFKPETDPVTLLIEHAQQKHLCEMVLRLDDEARKRAGKVAR